MNYVTHSVWLLIKWFMYQITPNTCPQHVLHTCGILLPVSSCLTHTHTHIYIHTNTQLVGNKACSVSPPKNDVYELGHFPLVSGISHLPQLSPVNTLQKLGLTLTGFRWRRLKNLKLHKFISRLTCFPVILITFFFYFIKFSHLYKSAGMLLPLHFIRMFLIGSGLRL